MIFDSSYILLYAEIGSSGAAYDPDQSLLRGSGYLFSVCLRLVPYRHFAKCLIDSIQARTPLFR